MKRIIIQILAAILLLGIVWYRSPSNKDLTKNSVEIFQEFRFKGVVANKYIDKAEHSYPMLEIRDSFTNGILAIKMDGQRRFLFDNIQTNDTIWKKAMSDTVFIKRGKDLRYYRLYFKDVDK